MKRVFLILSLLLSISLTARGEEMLTVTPVTAELHPGKAMILSFTAPEAAAASIFLADEEGEPVFVITEEFQAVAGFNQLYWNGTWQGEPAPEGDWLLTVSAEGQEDNTPVTIGRPVPVIRQVDLNGFDIQPQDALVLTFNCDTAAEAVITFRQEEEAQLAEIEAQAGDNSFAFTGRDILLAAEDAGIALMDGEAAVTLVLRDEEGLTSTEEYLDLELNGFEGLSAEEVPEIIAAAPSATPVPVSAAQQHLVMAASAGDQQDFTPSWTSPYENTDQGVTYWNTPMDITDEERIWQMLTSPITILDSTKDGAEKRQVVLRAEPDEKADGVGVVTCITQGVRVLSEDKDGWTLIEAYSSSFHDSAVKAWNMLVQGWIPTRFLKTKTPSQKTGIVIDKLTQRLYLFKDGKLYDTLLVSTGLSNERQPYNETRSGEFLLTSKVGEFRSDNLYCSLAIRFNSGDLLHEVPHLKNADGSKNYKNNEPKLGTRASHGCIRVQRKRTSKGTNMQWLWNNLDKNTRLVIWEDWQGRQAAYPDEDTVLYYNAKGGTMYHSADTCNSTKKGVVFTETFTYGELDQEPYASLTTCDYCNPPVRRSVIDGINEEHAAGGDHDPVITAARQKFLNGEYK